MIKLLLGHLWMLPISIFGALIAVFGGASYERQDKTTYALFFVARERGIWAWWFNKARFIAITLGGVVVFRDAKAVRWDRIIVHENVHVRQGMKWGLIFPVAYVVATIIAVVKGRHFYRGNSFEMEARRIERAFMGAPPDPQS